MPETAAFVMGAFSIPKPMPKTRYPTASTTTVVEPVSRDRISPEAASIVPATTSGSRGPRCPTSQPEIGANTTVIAAIGSVSSPGVQRGVPAH